MTCQFFFFEQSSFDDRLCRNPSMVGPRDPKRLETLHPSHPDQNILQRIVQRMPQMQSARHIRRRDNDREWLFGPVGLAMKISFFFPIGIPLFLGGRMIVLFWAVRFVS